MPLRSSNHPSYDKIFTIRRSGTATITESDIIPNHRALYIYCTSSGVITFTNLDGTTSAVDFIQNVPIILPLQVKKYAVTSGTFNIYGLV
jgi:hypothetical protein